MQCGDGDIISTDVFAEFCFSNGCFQSFEMEVSGASANEEQAIEASFAYGTTLDPVTDQLEEYNRKK